MSVVRGFFSGILNFLLFGVLVVLGFIISLNLTVLNPDFVTAEFKELDVYSTVIEQAKTMLPEQQLIDAQTVDELVNGLTPWFEEQADKVIRGVYAYLKENRELDVTISLEPVRAALKEKLNPGVLSSLPPQLQGATQSQIDAYMAPIYAGIDAVIPASFQLNKAVAGPEVIAQLGQVKNIIGYIDTTYIYLIVAAVVLILLIALAYWWQPKPITLSIGITFTLVGVVCILGPLLNNLIVQILSQVIGPTSLLSGLQTILPELAADITAPVRTYGIGFLISGVGLIIISVFFSSKESSPGSVQG